MKAVRSLHLLPRRPLRRWGGFAACQGLAALLVPVALLMSVALLVLGGCASPPPTRPAGVVGSAAGSGARSLDAQLAAIASDPSAAEVPRVIFVGAAMNGREDVFDRDIRAFDSALRQVFKERYRSVLLSNVRLESGARELPLASIDHLDDVFDALKQHRRRGDRYVVLITTHGAPGILEVEQAARWQQPRMLSSAKLADWVDQFDGRPVWLVISACYSGSHLHRLTQDHVLVMTASAPHRPSFGCSNEERNTWFMHELLATLQGAGAAPAVSLRTLWQGTLEGVSRREAHYRLQASQPQMRSGSAMEGRFDAPLVDF